MATAVCTVGAQECLSDHVARVCAPDAKSWVPVQCRAGELCQDGTCVVDPNPPCTPDDDTCMNDTTAMRCSATGMGFDVVTCPAGTKCSGKALCKGTCTVGSSYCNADGSISTCTDGKSYTTMACATTERCVQIGTVPYEMAACKPSECQPDPNGCDFVCGNKSDPNGANDPTYRSFCQPTTDGYKWIPVQCEAGKTCSPTGRACSDGPGYQADCKSQCTPGEQRCSTVDGTGGQTAIQTCGADGKWGAPMACNTDAANGGKVCFPKPGDTAHAICGDPACAQAKGACDPNGNFHACGADGVVATEFSPCMTGVCTQIGQVEGVWQPGACVPQCRGAEERCVGTGSSFQACTANGTWGAVQNCPGNKHCWQGQDAAGLLGKACGDCFPGFSRCADMAGNAASDGSGYLQQCDSTGTWATPSACTVGSCKAAPWAPAGAEAVCVAECIPNEKSCVGAPTNLAGIPYPGTTQESVCTAAGKKGTGTNCAAGTMCRKTSTGHDAGCVPCVGSSNESGMPDTRCVNSAGATGNTHVQTCMADSSGWQSVGTLVACGPGTTCSAALPFPAPPVWDRPYCHDITVTSGFTTVYKGPGTEHDLRSVPFSTPITCARVGGGSPIPCATKAGTSDYPDCCSNYCITDPSPQPARCE